MIAFDTNALVRMLIEDDKRQAEIVREIIKFAEKNAIKILILTEVLIETVWVLESIYKCSREEITLLLENLLYSSTFILSDPEVVIKATRQYKRGGDFADFILVEKAKQKKAKWFFSFDKMLIKKYPGFVVSKMDILKQN